MAYLYLIIAIIAEIVATTIMKDTNGFTVLWPSVFTILGYVVAFYMLSLCIQTNSNRHYICIVVRFWHNRNCGFGLDCTQTNVRLARNRRNCADTFRRSGNKNILQIDCINNLLAQCFIVLCFVYCRYEYS